MIVPGYLDGYEPPFEASPLVDGSALMADDRFWPAFLYTVGDSAAAPRAFGVDPADLGEVVDAFLDDRRWPVFSLRLAGTARVHVIMRNVPGEGGVDYVLDPGTGDDALPLAATDGHFRGPALAWHELIAAAGQPDPERTPGERLLLLLPACADRDRPGTAAVTVAAALTAVGAEPGSHRVGEELLGSARYWTRDCAWTAVDDVVICLGSHAYRRAGGGLTRRDLGLVTEAFRPSPEPLPTGAHRRRRRPGV